MKKITRQSLANSSSARWHETYGCGQYGRDKVAIGLSLQRMGATPDPDLVDAVIVNPSWTSVPSCDECNRRDLPFVIEVGQEPDYESHTASLCIDCIAKAAVLAQSS